MTVTSSTSSAPAATRVGFRYVLLSEWTKLRTLRVTGIGLLCFVAAGAAMSFMLTSGAVEEYATLAPQDRIGLSSLTLSLYGLLVAQLVLAVIGSMVMTSEYASGSIKTSVAAVPQRGRLLVAKAIVVSVLAFTAGSVTALIMVLVGGLSFNGQQEGGPFEPLVPSDLDVVMAVLGSGLYMAVVALMSLAVGVLVRWTAGAIAILVLGILLIPSMFESLPAPLAETLAKFWPTNAGMEIVLAGPGGLGPWAGFVVLAVFAAALLGAAYTVLRLRDA